MDDKNMYVHDAYIAFAERTTRRFWIITIILIFLLFGSNLGWLYYENQFEDIETTTIDATQEGSGLNIVSGGDLTYESTRENYKN